MIGCEDFHNFLYCQKYLQLSGLLVLDNPFSIYPCLLCGRYPPTDPLPKKLHIWLLVREQKNDYLMWCNLGRWFQFLMMTVNLWPIISLVCHWYGCKTLKWYREQEKWIQKTTSVIKYPMEISFSAVEGSYYARLIPSSSHKSSAGPLGISLTYTLTQSRKEKWPYYFYSCVHLKSLSLRWLDFRNLFLICTSWEIGSKVENISNC